MAGVNGVIVEGPSGSCKSAAIAACCDELSLQVYACWMR